jgi:hypothetical protein
MPIPRTIDVETEFDRIFTVVGGGNLVSLR